MAKLSTLNIQEIFRQDANRIIEARNRAKLIHATTDIKAAGNEVEEEVRNFLKKRLPSNYYVGHGHLIDCEQKTSPQFDILISDNTTIPILLRTNDSTEYFPCESVYAIGEVKSSFIQSEKPIEKFCESLKLIKEEMKREIVYNTAFNGEINDNSLLRDMVLGKPNRVLNSIYSFMIFVNSEGFKIEEFTKCIEKFENRYLPNNIILLDQGVIFYGSLGDKGMVTERYPEFPNATNNDWILSPFGESPNNIGNHLGFLYYNLLSHLNSSLLDPLNLMPYFNRLFFGKRSKTQIINNKA